MAATCILVVDDGPQLLEDLKWAAEKAAGGKVLTAGSAQEAIRLIAENNFDLIITDLAMEREDSGLDVLAAAKEKDWWTQLILVTAFGEPNPTGPKAILKGAYVYVDRNAPGNYLNRLRQLIPHALQRRQEKLREEAQNEGGKE